MRRIISSLVFLHYVLLLIGQNPDSLQVGIHQLQQEYYSSLKSEGRIEKTTPGSLPIDLATDGKKVNRKVIGWHPYWASPAAYTLYNYDALTHIAWFSYEVDTATGGYLSIHEWNTTSVINYAHQRGTKVLLTVTNFGALRNTELLTDTVKQLTLLSTIVNLLKTRNGDGVNFDLESVPVTQRANLVSFMKRARRIIKTQLPSAEISMATPAVDWSGSWDLPQLSAQCDYLIIMGYDYYWRGSPTAGPVAPLEGETYNVTRTVNTYLSAGVPSGKLVLGVPWYGYDWPVSNSSRKAPSTGSATARFYHSAEALASEHGYLFDQATKVPWVSYSISPTWRQLWYDNVQSLGMKYSLVGSKNMAGIGIWALSYEGGDNQMWEKIISSFSSFDTTATRILKIYPSPSSGQVTLEYYLTSNNEISIEFFDLNGRKILMAFSGRIDAGFHSLNFDISGYGSGMYICVVRGRNFFDSRKIILTRE